MGRLQHRRSISAKPGVYARIQSHCDAQGISVASFVEAVITQALDQAGAPVPIVEAGGYPKRLRPLSEGHATEAAAHFTF
jgi:hypothetical protein